MPAAAANGITIEYETFGDPSAPPVLLIMGLGSQLTRWPLTFCTAVAERGYHVIRYDNRDVGLSKWFDEAGAPTIEDLFTGKAAPPYLIGDMADDAVGLLDALGCDSAHIVGVSAGGMIAQTVAIKHPERVRSLVSISSTTGDPSVGRADPTVATAVIGPPPTTREGAAERAVTLARTLGSPAFPFDETFVREQETAAFDRAFHPAGSMRHAAAFALQPDRTELLGKVTAPTLVIHGESDTVVNPSGGRATAAAVPGAKLHMVPGMGHEIPTQLHEEFADLLASHFATV